MLGGVRSFFGALKVTERNNIITISGWNSEHLRQTLEKIYSTSKVYRYMFTRSGSHDLRFFSFFALEVAHILKVIHESPLSTYRERRNCESALEGLYSHTWLKSTVSTDIVKCVDLQYLRNLKLTPKPYQYDFLNRYGELIPRMNLRGMLLASPPGTGKSLSLDSDIRIPGGWKKMRDIQVGDVVTARDGSPTTVTGVYPQGVLPAYQVTFKDGRSVVASGDHLWTTYYKDASGGKQWDVRNTDEIRRLLSLKTPRVYIPLIDSEDSPDKDLPIDPYTLGILLGDGGISGRNIMFSTADAEVVHHIEKALPENISVKRVPDSYDYRISRKEFNVGRNPYTDALDALGLMGLKSHQKFIPGDYLEGSRAQRIALLQGLMDSDGTADKSGSVSFGTTSPMLYNSVMYLVRSLGGIARKSDRQSSYTHNGIIHDGKPSYQVNIRMKDPSICFRLERKKSRVKANNQYSDGLKLEVVSVVPVESREMQCISVDHPEKLFVTNDFIVTHNTFMDLAIAACLIPRGLAEVKIIISPKNAVHLVWEDTIQTLFKKRPTDWISTTPGDAPLGKEYYIFHYEALPRAVDLAKRLKARGIKAFIIIDESHNFNSTKSNRTNSLVDLCKVGPFMSIWASGSPIKALGIEVIPLLRSIDPLFTPEVEAVFKKLFGGDEGEAVTIVNHRIGEVSFKIDKTVAVAEKPVLKKVKVKLRDPSKYLLSNIKIEMQEYIDHRLEELKGDLGKYNEVFDSCVRFHAIKLRTPEERKRFDQYENIVAALKKGTATNGRPDPDMLSFCKDYETRYLIPSLPTAMQREFRASRSIVKSMILKVRGEALGKVLAKRRAECAGELSQHCDLETIIANGVAKTLIFSTYTDALRQAGKYLTGKGLNCVNVWGDTAKLVTQIVREFRNNPKVNPLLATFASLSTAVPITEANQVVFLELPPRQYIYEQTVARALRLGQKNTVYVFEILLDTGLEPNISTRGDEIITWSRNQVTALIGESFGGPQDDEYDIEQYDSTKALAGAEDEASRMR